MTQTLESLFFYQLACACSHATMTTTICPKTMQDSNIRTVECEGNKSECELEIKIVAMEKAKEDRTVVLAAPPPVTGQAAVIQLTEKKVIIKAGKKSATTIIKIYPKQMVLNKQNVTLSCTPQWKEGGISKLTILLKRK